MAQRTFNGRQVEEVIFPVGYSPPAGTIVVPPGGATSANQAEGNAYLSSIDTDLGAASDAAATTDTGSFSLLALVKRLLQRITVVVGHVDGLEGSTSSIDGKLPALSGGAVPVALNVQQGSGTVTATTTRVTLATDGPGVSNLASIAGLSIPAHDYIALSYTGSNLTGVQYRTGGASGTIVGTLTLAYSGSNLISVTRS